MKSRLTRSSRSCGVTSYRIAMAPREVLLESGAAQTSKVRASVADNCSRSRSVSPESTTCFRTRKSPGSRTIRIRGTPSAVWWSTTPCWKDGLLEGVIAKRNVQLRVDRQYGLGHAGEDRLAARQFHAEAADQFGNPRSHARERAGERAELVVPGLQLLAGGAVIQHTVHEGGKPADAAGRGGAAEANLPQATGFHGSRP